MALVTVQDYVDQARVLLQDTYAAGYRYATSDLVEALNIATMEGVRLRPDLFFKAMRDDSYPVYSESNLSKTVVFGSRYQFALLSFMVGMAQLRDNEDNQDSRAVTLLNKFVSQLISIPA